MAAGRPDGDGDSRRALIALLKQRAARVRSIRSASEWTATPPPAEARPAIAPSLALAAILLLAAALRGWNFGAGGVVVPYYLAGVRSQLAGWHNFFFNAFDPTGFVSLDKPPVAFWLQTVSAKLLGFGAASVLLPQLLEGVAAVALLYWLVRHRFGVAAGLLAALFLALSPVSVAVDRSNNTESCLVLVLLLAAWALTRAVETGRLASLLLAALGVGVGFNVKMLVAFGVVPAFVLVYLFAAPGSWPRRFGHLTAAAAVLAAVSLSWSAAYDLTPSANRPFVDSTEGNSMLELAVGHNLAQRFVRRGDGRRVEPGAFPQPAASAIPSRDSAPAGPLRLAAPPLAAQVGWLFPLAPIGGIAAWRRHRHSPGRENCQLAMWGGWALAYGAVFSAAGGLFHAYYLAAMAPALAALSAIGTVCLRRDYREDSRAPLLVAILATALWQAYIVQFFLGGSLEVGHVWLPAVLVAGAAAVSAVLWWRHGPSPAAAATAVTILLAMPAAWSAGTAMVRLPAGFPTAQPPFLTAEAQLRRGRFAMVAGAIAGDPKLIAFLTASRRDEQFLLAAVNARLAAPLIIATGEPVVALGGFSGRDPILAPEDFARLVAAGRVRFALVGEGAEGLRRVYGEGHQKALVEWIRSNGRPVDPALWRSPAAVTRPLRSAESVGAELYDLRPPGDAGG